VSTRYPGELKFEFGSTITVLTTAAICPDSDKHVKNQGIFTGVVLDETKLNLKRDPKHISISLDNVPGLETNGDGDYSGDYYKPETSKYDWEKDDKKKEHCDWEKDDKKKEHCDWEKDDKKKEHCDWEKDDKKKEHCDWEKDDKKKEHCDWKKDDKKEDYEWDKDDKKKVYCAWDKDNKKKPHYECDKDDKKDDKKHDKEIEVKKAEKFLVLSLTCPSFPFTPGQIVWINIDQIVAFSSACRNE
jgi:hypothetical protein